MMRGPMKSKRPTILRLSNMSLLFPILMMIMTPVQGGPFPVCRICSRGAEVVPVSGAQDTKCNELLEFGLNGEIPKVICDSLPVSLEGVCTCRTQAPTIAPSPRPSTASPTFSAAPSPEPSTAAPSSAPSTAEPSTAPTTLAPSLAPATAAPSLAPATAAPTLAPITVAPSLAPTEAPSAVCSNILGTCSNDDGCCGGLVCRGSTYCDRSFLPRAPKDAFREADFRFENDLNLRLRGGGRQRNLKGSSSSSSSDSMSSSSSRSSRSSPNNTDMQA